MAPTGGRFRSRMGSARYYGLIRQQGDRRELTELGQRVLSEGVEGVQARRQAVLNTGFRAVFSQFRGREANADLIKARLQDDYGVPAPASAAIAAALIESGQQSGLIKSGRFDTEAIEDALSAIPDSETSVVPVSAAASRGTTRSARVAIPAQGPTANLPASTQQPATSSRQSPSLHVDVQIHIPATATNDQIDQIFASMAKHLYGRE